jgi:hypothetical protein
LPTFTRSACRQALGPPSRRWNGVCSGRIFGTPRSVAGEWGTGVF